MEFDWTIRKIPEWRAWMEKAPRLNWLQSLPFARASRMLERKTTRMALIKEGGEELGMMAIQEIKLGPVHVIYLYRGPIWFDGKSDSERLSEFARLFNKTFPRRFLRMRRWLPEWRTNESAFELLEEAGFRRKNLSFETIWLDLTLEESELRKNLKQKWRNALNKSEKSNLELRVDAKGVTAPNFLRCYDGDKKIKGYRGRSRSFLLEEIKTASVFKDVMILWAYLKSMPVAGILVVKHGKSATYRVGWTSEQGRHANAHNFLLWSAVKLLKQKKVTQFDLGGVEPGTAEGLTKFKSGMGGESYKLLGVFS